MMISESRVRRIIREEARRVLREGADAEEIKAAVDFVLKSFSKDIDYLRSQADALTGYLRGYKEDDFDVDADHPGLRGARSLVGAIVDQLSYGQWNAPTADVRAVLQIINDRLNGPRAASPRGRVESVIDDFKSEGKSSWERVSNDFHAMADGDEVDLAQNQYPGLSRSDFRRIANELDKHFGL